MNEINKYISSTDLNSLMNLSHITRDDQVVDVASDGTVTEPYDRNWTNTAYRTGRSWSKTGGGRDDLVNIQELMKRCLLCYVQCTDNPKAKEEIEGALNGAVKGLDHLLVGYKQKDEKTEKSKDYWSSWKITDGWSLGNARDYVGAGDCKDAIKNIESIMKSVTETLASTKNKQFETKISSEKAFQFNLMEASMITGANNLGQNEFVEYYIERINTFIFLNESTLNDEDKAFLNALKTMLSESQFAKGEALLDQLENMKQFQSEVGATTHIEMHGFAEPFLINIFKEQDGSYTLAEINTGAGSSATFPPTQEYTGLTRDEVRQFLIKAKEIQLNGVFSKMEAQGVYEDLFRDVLPHKAVKGRIPTRRAPQGNYGLRNVKEELIFSFQKAGKIELANKFLSNVAVSRKERSLDPVIPLIDEKATLVKNMKDTFPELANYDLGGLENLSTSTILSIVSSFKTNDTKSLTEVVNGENLYANVLSDLDRLKDQLGGSPVFQGKPTIHTGDDGKYLFGIPLNNAKDWFRMTKEEKWQPEGFWNNAAHMFGVTDNNKLSQYEEAYVRIQRFGMLLANKDRFFEILDKEQTGRYNEMGDIAGLAWHVKDNSPQMEKDYIQLVEQFLTKYFELAKKQGDQALVEYFNVLKGVCFEHRCRSIEEYIAHIESSEVMQQLEDIADFDTTIPPDHREQRSAFNTILGEMNDARPTAFRKLLLEKGIFDKKFKEENGEWVSPTLERFHNFVLTQQAPPNYLLESYSTKDFLEIEFEIFKASGKTAKDEFIQQLKARLDKLDGSIELEEGDFKIDSEMTVKFINESF